MLNISLAYRIVGKKEYLKRKLLCSEQFIKIFMKGCKKKKEKKRKEKKARKENQKKKKPKKKTPPQKKN